MPELRDIFSRDHGQELILVEGWIASDPDHPNDEIEVVIPEYDDDISWEVGHFEPRARWDGGQPLLPSRGDWCLVGIDASGDPHLIKWYTEDPT
jgi:hypothetical protein